MPKGLKRYQDRGQLHFVTFSCDQRQPYLNTPQSRDLFVETLEQMRQRYLFPVLGYVVMPEHVHLLLGEPPEHPLSIAIKALKLSVSKRSQERPFWQPRYYDFNVFTTQKIKEKLHYTHQNPVERGLVPLAELWKWSSYDFYTIGAELPVKIS
jgi:putative transposase